MTWGMNLPVCPMAYIYAVQIFNHPFGVIKEQFRVNTSQAAQTFAASEPYSS